MSLQPVKADFVGADRVLQGTNWSRTIPMGQDLTAYNPALTPGAVLRGALKTRDLRTTIASSAAGTMVLSFDDPTTLRVEFTPATASAVAGVGYVWDVEAVNGLTLKVDRIAEGEATLAREVTTAST